MKRFLSLATSALAMCMPCAFATNSAAAAISLSEPMHVHEAKDRVSVSWVDYRVPAIQLVRADGTAVLLPKELDDGRPVILNFIYTTCETICPLSSGTFSQVQAKLGPERKGVHLVSISIDPEQDTPARLREYAKKFGAGPGWSHYTGTVQATAATLQAFGVNWSDKMSHTPVTLLRAAPGKAWMRIDGFVTPDELLSHYHDLLAAR
jgi:protein SCO1/2